MKSVKHIITCIMLCTTMPVFYSCSSKDLDYQKACEELNYTKAWNIVNHLKKEYDEAYAKGTTFWEWYGFVKDDKTAKEKEYETAFDYVFRSEAHYLLSIDDESSARRLLVLLNEQGFEWL